MKATRRSERKEFAVTAAVALAVCLAVQAFDRIVLWKLADSTMIFADWDGFVAVASANPFGFIDWFARWLCAATLVPGGFLLTTLLLAVAMAVTFAIRGVRASVAAWLPTILFIVPLVNLGERVWVLRTPHFIHWNLLWYVIIAATLALARGRGLLILAGAVLAAMLGTFAVNDIPFIETLQYGFGIHPVIEWLEWMSGDFVTLGVAAVLVVAALGTFERVETSPVFARFGRYAPPVLLVVLAAVLWRKRDCRDQLAMERFARERKFEEVLKVAPDKARPERMETAWRILAMYRLDRLDRDLYRFPIIGSHVDTEEDEMIMEGMTYLFEFGLVQPSRHWAFETMTVKGCQPEHYRLLGEGALAIGDGELAKRNFHQLARCPFRGDAAKRRLELLETGLQSAEAFPDLVDVADMYKVWQDYSNREGAAYFCPDRVGERFVYSLFMSLKSCPPRMLKMLFASALLNGDTRLLKDNGKALEKLYPDGRIGPVFLEALK